MAKFLGVISNSAPSPSDDRILEFTDLDLLANFLFNESQNLFCEFLQKVQFINDREILIQDNYNEITRIYELYKFLNAKTIEIEQDTEKISAWVGKMENSINDIERLPNNFVACKCTPHLERNKALDMLVQLSTDVRNIESQVVEIKEQESTMPVTDPCDLNNRLLPFLNLHLMILEQIEERICKLTDMLRQVGEMFINAHKRIVGACFHKARHGYASEC